MSRPVPGPARRDVATNSMAVAGWTLVSRITGVGRAAAIAAVLGPTFFGNLFESANFLPNIIYVFLTGHILTSLLVPPLVRMGDAGDHAALRSFVRGITGIVTFGFGAFACVVMLGAPLLVRLLTIGVPDEAVADHQQRVGVLLLVLVLPQVVLYALSGVGAAVQHAHGRFALAAAAPVLENVGVMVVMGVYALRFGTGHDMASVGNQEVLLLGIGSTASVALHAAAQVWGAARQGVLMLPSLRWRTPEIIGVLRLSLPASGTTAVQGLRHIAILLIAGSIPGGVVAFRMAVNFYNLPVAVGAKPVAAASLPELARLSGRGSSVELWHRWLRSISLALFFAVPASLAYVVLARPIAEAAAFGEFASDPGVHLLAVSIAALGLGILGETLYSVCSSGAYAMGDASTPLRAGWVKAGITAAFIGLLFPFADGAAVLVVLGLGISLGDVVAGIFLYRAVGRRIAVGPSTIHRPVAVTVLASLAMAGVALGVATGVSRALDTRGGHVAALLLALGLGGATYLYLQLRSGSPDLLELVPSSLRARIRRPGRARAAAAHPEPEPAPAPTPLVPVPAAAVAGIPAAAVGEGDDDDDPDGPGLVHQGEDLAILGLVTATAVLAIPLLSSDPVIGVAMGVAAAVVVAVMAHPPVAAYAYLGLCPLLVGFERDTFLPTLRPSEALLGLVAAGLFGRRMLGLLAGEPLRRKPSALQSSIVAMAVTSSVLPLLWMLARGATPSFADVLYAVTLWKYVGIFVLVRSVITSVDQVKRCLQVVLVASSLVAVVAILQSVGVGAVTGALDRLYAGTERDLFNHRGSSLLNSSHAVGDVMVINLALVMALGAMRRWTPVLAALAGLFFLGTLASGQFSAVIGLVIGVWVAGYLTHTLLLSTTAALPTTAAGLVVLRPIVERRLEGFSSTVGVPPSWISRWDNLTTYFWPDLFHNFNYVFGVRPAARLPAPEAWREWVYIESGHTWLLWTGGIPFFVAYVAFTVIAIRLTLSVARQRRDEVGVAAVAACSGMALITVLMVLDVHLTLRGTSDLLFPLLALVVAGRALPDRLRRRAYVQRPLVLQR